MSRKNVSVREKSFRESMADQLLKKNNTENDTDRKRNTARGQNFQKNKSQQEQLKQKKKELDVYKMQTFTPSWRDTSGNSRRDQLKRDADFVGRYSAIDKILNKKQPYIDDTNALKQDAAIMAQYAASKQKVKTGSVSANEAARIGRTPDFMIDQDKLAEVNRFYDMIDRVKRIDDAYKNPGQVWGGRTKEVSEALNFENAVKDIRNRADIRNAGMNDLEGDISELNREQRNQRREDANRRLEEIAQKRADLESIYNLSEEELAERFPEEYQGYLSYLNEPGHPERIDFIDYLDMNKALDSKSLGYDYDEVELRKVLNDINYWDEQDHNLDVLTNKETRAAEKYSLIQQNRGRQQKIDELYNQLAVADQTTDVDGIRQQISNLEAEIERDNNRLKELDQYGLLDDNVADDTAYHPEYFEAYKEKNPEMVANATTETNNIHVIMDFLNKGETFQKWYENEGFERTITGSFSGAQALFAFPEIKDQLTALYNDAVSNGRQPVEAQAFFNALQPYMNQYLRIYEEIENRSNAAQHPGLMTLGETVESTLTALPQMMGTAYGLATGAQWASDKNSPWFATQRQSSDVESQVSEMLGPVGGFIYQAGLSAFKNLMRATAMSGLGAAAEIGTLTQFFGEAFNSSYYSGLDKFKNQDKAAIYALVDAGISTFFEVASVEKMFSDPSNYIQYLLQNMGAEMSEEGFEAMFGPYIHKLMDGNHEWEERGAEIFSEMRKNGYFTNANGEKVAITDETYGEAAQMAKAQAMREWNAEIIKNMGSAALSVGGPAVFGGVKNVIQRRAENTQLGKNVKSSGISEKDSSADKMAQEAVNEFAFLEAASNMGENTKSAKLALEIRNKLGKGKRVSNADFGKLARTVVSESNEQISGITMNVLQDKVKQDLAELNISEEDRTLMAEMIAKKIIGAAMTDAERYAFSQSETAQEIAATYGIGIGTGMASVVDMGRVSEAAAEIGEQTKGLQKTQKTVLEMALGPIDEKNTAESVRGVTAGAKVAGKNDFLVAQGKRTNSDAEVIADGKIADIKGIALKTVTNPDTNKQEIRFQVTTSDGREVDLSQVKAASKGVAETLQFLQNDQGQTVGNNLANAVLNIAMQNNSDATKTLTGAVRIMWAAATEQKTPVTGLNKQDTEAIQAAVKADMKAAEDDRLSRFRQIKPGQGKVSFNGAEYGSNEFNNAVQKLGGTYRTEAQAIGSIAKSAGFDVELYFDEKDTANQGSFSQSGGIRINLAGTFTADGAHRSALATFAHEITHNLEANSPDMYRALKRFVFSSLGNKFDLQNELQTIMATYKAHGQTLDISGAVAELVAKASEQVLTDEEVIKQIKGEEPDLSGAMSSSVKRLVERVNNLRGEALNTSSKYARALMQVNSQVGKIWAAAYQEAKGARGVAAGTETVQESFQENEEKHRKQTIDIHDALRNSIKYNKYFTYDSLVSKDAIRAIPLDPIDITKSRQQIMDDAMRNAEESGRKDGEFAYVPVYDIGTEIRIGKRGLRHGMGHYRLSQPIAEHLGEVLKESVLINTSRGRVKGQTGNYVLLGAGMNSNGKGITYALFTVNSYTDELEDVDFLYAMRTSGADVENNKKADAQSAKVSSGKSGIPLSASKVSIAKALKDVKNDFSNVFSTDVLHHFGMKRDFSDDNAKYLQHSFQEDQEYMAAVDSGDMDAAQKIVDQAAQRAGYTDRAYHGTNLFGFTEFNLKAGQNTIFVAYDQKLASTYTETEDIREIKDRNGVPKNHYVMNDEEFLAYAKETLKTMKGNKVVDIRPIDAKNWTGNNKKYEVEYEDPIDKAFYGKETSTSVYRRHELNDLIMWTINKTGETNGIYDLYTRPGNQLIVDAEGSNWNKIPFDLYGWEERGDDLRGHHWVPTDYEWDEEFDWDDYDNGEFRQEHAKTRDIARWAKAHGYDSVRINNLYDNGGRNGIVSHEEARGDIGIFFNENDIKSADPITTDDQGNLIPPSERFNDQKTDIRYSMQEQDEKYSAAVKAGNMDAAQRMVDAAAKQNGFILKVYHGTPTGGFTVFRDWSYFTENKDYADRYQNASASSIRGSYETTNPMTYALYMNPGKVFDTRKPAAAKLYNEARMEYGLGELGNTDSGLPDWTDGRDIIEFIEDRGLDYDTILLDEGGDPGENGPTKRGISYVTRANNVKNADPVTYDSKGKIVKLSDRFNRKSNNIQFSMQDPVEVNKEGLIAVHNLTKKNLIDTLKEGGFTAPSIAVVLAKMGHSKFGPISAVFKPSAIDPKRSVKNKIYGTDAWTPTRSNAQIETKLDYQVLQDARDTIESLLQDERDVWKNEAMNWVNQWLYEDQTTDTLEEMIEKARRNDGMVAAFEIAQGRELKEKTRAEKVRSDLYADKVHIYEDFLNHLEEKGMLQEFLNDLHNVNGNVMLDKYIDLFAESNDVAAKQVKAYKEKSEGLAKRVIFNTMRQSGIYEEDGREIKMVDVFNKIDTANSIRRQWIENKSRRDEFNNWVTGLIGKALGKKGVYNGKEKFTSSGNKRSFEALHMEPTAENIVKAMYTNHPAKGGEAGGATGLMAKASKEYGSLQDVREDAARLQMIQDEEYKKLINALDDKLSDFVQRVSDGIGLDYYTIKEELIEAAGNYAKNPTAAAIRRYMEKEGIKLTAEQLIEAQELMEEARNIPTGYFEAKPESVKGFDELQTIIMAEDEELEQMLTERGIHYDIYDGTEEERLRILNEQTDAQFSFMDETDVDARAWMETVNENSLQTEAEKQLLRNFKSLRVRVSLKQEQERNIQDEIRRLQDVLKGGGEGAAIETIENALETMGIGIKYTRTARYITKEGAIIGKMAGRNGVRLNANQAAVAAELEKAGFAYDKLTNIYTYANKSRKTMGQTQIEQKLKGLQTRLEKATREKEAAQAELAKITSSQGYASMMYRQQRILNDFVYGRTQGEVRGAVDKLEASAARIAQKIADEQAKAEEQAKNSIVQRFREILGTTTIDQTAAALKKRYNSTWTKNQLKVYLEPIILKMKAGEDFQSDVETLAGILVNSDSTNTYEELSSLRGLVVTLGPGAQKELRAQNSNLKEIRARLAGTGIQVKFGERSSLEADIEDLRAEYPNIPELGDEKDALENFVRWVEGMKSQSAANEFYEQRIAEAMAVVIQQAAGTAKGIYMPTDPKAAKQVLAMMEFVKSLNAETQSAQKILQDVADDLEEMQKAGRQASGMAVAMTHDATVAIDYFNRVARIAEDQAKQKTRKDLIEQLKSEQAQKIAKNNEEWRNLIERDAQARKQMERNMAARGQINTCIKRLYDLLKNPKGMRNIPEHMQGLAREVIGAIVENDLSEMKHKISRIEKKNLMEAQRVLQAWEARDGKPVLPGADELDEENASLLVLNQDLQQIYEGIEEYNQEIRGKNKLNTLQQRGEILTKIQEAVSEIYTAIRAEGEVFMRGRKVAIEDAAAEVMNGTGGKKFREWYGKAGRALAGMHKAIVSGNMTPEYFFRTIGNKGLNELWDNYHAAENRNGLELAKAKARMDEIAKKYGYSTWDMKKRYTVQMESGEVQMTLGQIMALWATWNRENTLGPEMSNHLSGGGFYVEQQDLREGWLGRVSVEKKTHKLAETEEETGYNPDIAEIEKLMTQEQKDYVNDVVQFMSNDMSELGNEASMAAYGIRMYKEKYYFPFQMWDGIKSKKSNEAAQGANVDRAFHPSFSKSRMHGANNAVVIGDFTQTAADHIAGMINYATMGLANESLQKVLNQQVQEGGELNQTKRNIRVILEEAYGQEATQYLTELQRQLNGGAVRTSKSLWDKAITMFRKNAVAGSLSVALQQPLSYIRAAMLVNPKYLAAALNPATWKGSYQEMMAHSGVAVIKDMGRFDMNAGQSAREYLTPDELEKKAAKIWGQITEKATILPELMDRMTWTRMWSACKAEQAEQHPEMDVKSDEFLDMVGERFNELMRRTQVYDSVLVKSANMRSDNYWIKSLTSFMAEPTLTLNVLADALREAASGAKGGTVLLAKAGATFILSAVLQSFFKGLMGSGRNPDDKKNWDENFLYRFWNNFISEADPLQLIPGYNDLVTLLKDGEVADDAMGAIGKLFTAGKGTIDVLLGNGNKGVYRDIEDSVGQLTQLFTNLPAKNIMRDARAMFNFFTQPYAKRPTSASVLLHQTRDVAANADNMIGVINKWLGEAGYQTSNTAYYQRIYQAKKAGNEQAAQSMIDYLLTGKGVTEKAITSGVSSAAKKDTGATEAETAEFLINEGSTSADDYVTGQLKAGKITAEEARKLLKQAQPEKSDDDIWWSVDRIEYQRATGAESISGKYYRLWDAMDANRAEEIGDALKIMTNHGLIAKNIKTEITKHYKQAYLSANSEGKRKIKDAIQKAYRKLGYTAEDANKMISNWEKDAKKKKN